MITDSRKTELVRTSTRTIIDLVNNTQMEKLLNELLWQLPSVQDTTMLVLITSEFKLICTRQIRASKIIQSMRQTITFPLAVEELSDYQRLELVQTLTTQHMEAIWANELHNLPKKTGDFFKKSLVKKLKLRVSNNGSMVTSTLQLTT